MSTSGSASASTRPAAPGPPTPPRFFCGLDLGKASDYTALAILKATGADAGLDVVHLARWALGTPYPAIVADVGALMARPELRPAPHAAPWLAIDSTGVGRPVVDMLAEARPDAVLVAITITAGREANSTTWEGIGAHHLVPKIDLVGAVNRGLQGGSLRVVPGLEHAETLRRELQEFRVKVTDHANETFEHRVGQHDDLVLAVAMAAWLAGRATPNPSVAGAEGVDTRALRPPTLGRRPGRPHDRRALDEYLGRHRRGHDPRHHYR